MPITPEGNFLAYKGVNQDFTDKYSGKFDNSVGQTLEMRRNNVCDDVNVGCSAGFHAGSYEYARGWAGSPASNTIPNIHKETLSHAHSDPFPSPGAPGAGRKHPGHETAADFSK